MARLAAEDYVRPAIVAAEPPSRRAARIRFSLVIGLVALAVAVGVVALVYQLTNSGVSDPQGAAARTPVVAAQR